MATTTLGRKENCHHHPQKGRRLATTTLKEKGDSHHSTGCKHTQGWQDKDGKSKGKGKRAGASAVLTNNVVGEDVYKFEREENEEDWETFLNSDSIGQLIALATINGW